MFVFFNTLAFYIVMTYVLLVINRSSSNSTIQSVYSSCYQKNAVENKQQHICLSHFYKCLNKTNRQKCLQRHRILFQVYRETKLFAILLNRRDWLFVHFLHSRYICYKNLICYTVIHSNESISWPKSTAKKY